MTVNGVIINAHFFCKAVGIERPLKLSDPVAFMEQKVKELNLDWNEIAKHVNTHREEYKERRRKSQRKKAEKLKQEEESFFWENNVAPTKTRNCLRCEVSFTSKFGNRLCGDCNHVVKEILVDAYE